MSITLSALQKQRRDSAANWTAENPTLLAGEIGIESDTGYWKVGDGSTAWTSLAYISGLGAEIPVSRLADGAAGQIIQTDTAGTGVEWSSTANLPLGTAATPAYRFQGDTNTGIYSPGADQVAISTGGSGRLFVDASGRVGVGIGTSAPVSSLTVVGNATLDANSFYSSNLYYDGAWKHLGNGYGGYIKPADSLGGCVIGVTPNNTAGVGAAATVSTRFKISPEGTTSCLAAASTAPFTANIGGGEVARIDSSGRLLVGTSSGILVAGATAGIQNASVSGFIDSLRFSNDSFPPLLKFVKSRSATVGTNTLVQANDGLGQIGFVGADGTNYLFGASITASVDGTPGANDMPGRLVFSTTADGASSPTERMRIRNNGSILLNTTSEAVAFVNSTGMSVSSTGQTEISVDNNDVLKINRKTSDGTLIGFLQDATTEGSISVSGTTVSYNGAHLSRWSQLPSGAERTEILRGTVLSNIDEMCEWGEEDNEQLNRMKVSDVESDKNVAGVFQAWDDDDDTYTNDFYCAMTGDFIIRIGAGVTVERGDLLMSAGDGTAKPQDDDIIRSKTIAKVTSTNVSCTYEDGSYCVPCVLMAC